MDKFLWLISHFSARVAVCVLSVPIIVWALLLNDAGKLMPLIESNLYILCSVIVVMFATSIISAYIGGKAGYKYVEMGRSRKWEYRNTPFSRGDNLFRNVLYWACKFALLPIIVILLPIAIFALIKLICLIQ